MPKHITTKLNGTAVSPKPIVKSEDSKYKVEIKMEMSTEKHFQHKPVPSSKRAKIPQDVTQKYRPNFLLDNWDIETNGQHDTPAAETLIPKIIHPHRRTCSKNYTLQVATKSQTVLDEDTLTPPTPSQTITTTRGNIVHPSGRLCSKSNKDSHTDKNESNKTTPSGCKKELKVATTEIDSAISSSKPCSTSALIVHHRSR